MNSYGNIMRTFLARYMARHGYTSASQVNAGDCEGFALELAEVLPGALVVYTEDFIDWDSPEWPGGHAWVSWEGRYYDAECPEGVTDWKELPFFVRKEKTS